MAITLPQQQLGDESLPARTVKRDLLLVLGFAVGLRLLFLALTADTYDYDEFVLLLLGRDYTHGARIYHDFMFFHPPGVLVLLRALQPAIQLWWPLARLDMVAVDTASALLVWRIGSQLYGRRAGLAAGLLYAASPLALVSATRVGQDPLIAALGLLGLCLLVTSSTWRSSLIAGACLALAVWIKYPAVYFLPVYLIAAPRRIPGILVGLGGGIMLLLLPFHSDWAAFYQQTVEFQRSRWLMSLDQRISTTVLFWLLINLPAVPALFYLRPPLWLRTGFLLGALFVLSPQVYYHYFVVVVPFAALLAGPLVALLPSVRRKVAVLAGLALVVCWGEFLDHGGASPLYVTAAHLSAIRPTVALLRHVTVAQQPVLADRFEYAYLADRPALDHYFWNVGVLVNAHYLEARVGGAGAVVMSYGPSSGYPTGFEAYLNAHFRRVDTPAASTWLPRRSATR